MSESWVDLVKATLYFTLVSRDVDSKTLTTAGINAKEMRKAIGYTDVALRTNSKNITALRPIDMCRKPQTNIFRMPLTLPLLKIAELRRAEHFALCEFRRLFNKPGEYVKTQLSLKVCGKQYYPDFLIGTNGEEFHSEFDEDGHRGYNREDELRRMFDLNSVFGRCFRVYYKRGDDLESNVRRIIRDATQKIRNTQTDADVVFISENVEVVRLSPCIDDDIGVFELGDKTLTWIAI